MILILISLFSILRSQVCETNTTLGVNIFPSAGSPFVMPLQNYFEGSGLDYQLSTLPQASILQAQTQTLSVQGQPNWGTLKLYIGNPIDQISFNYLIDSYIDAVHYAILQETEEGYQVTIIKQVSADNSYSVNNSPIIIPCNRNLDLVSSTCYNIDYFKTQLIVTCVSQNTLIFYVIDIDSKGNSIAVPISTGDTVGPNPISSNLQIINQLYDTQLIVSFTYQRITIQPKTIYTQSVYQYKLVQGTTLLKPIIIQLQAQQTTTNQISNFVNYDGSYFLLTSTTLTLNSLNGVLSTLQTTGTTFFYDFGVDQMYVNDLDYVISILTNNGLQNYVYNSSSQSFLAGNQIAYPNGLPQPSVSGINQILLNAQYVIVSQGTSMVIYPSFFNSYPYFIYANSYTDTTIISFDVLSNLVYTYYQGGYSQFTLQSPSLIIGPDLTNPTDNGLISVIATSYDGTQCGILFNYTIINTTSPAEVTVGSLPDTNIPFAKPTVQAMSPYFYGNNLTYTVQTTPIAQNIEIKQVEILAIETPQGTTLAFGQIFASPYDNNSYLEIIQTITGGTTELQIVYSGEYISQLVAYRQVYGNGIIQAASVGASSYQSEINLAFLIGNSVYIYTVPWYTPIQSPITQQTIIQVPGGSEFPPTINFAKITYLSSLLYIITNDPKSLLVYSQSSEYLYTFCPFGFMPNAIYTNYQSYGNWIFIDNQYELIIAECTYISCVIFQTIPYPQNHAQVSVGVGLLKEGIYIAVTNGNIQSISFYYRNFLASSFYLSNSYNIAIPDYFVIQYPIQASFTNSKFYIAWNNTTYNRKNNQFLELAIFQPSYGINNVLYSSKYIDQQSNINYITAVYVNSKTPYDIVMINGQTSNTLTNLIYLQVWNQTIIQFVPPELNSATETYQMLYSAVSPSSANTASIDQIIQVINPQIAVLNLALPQGYSYQYLNNYGLATIQPELYFGGIIQNYTASYYNRYNISQTSNVTKIINPITESGIYIDTLTLGSQLSACTGRLNNNTTPLLVFFATPYILFYLNPQQVSGNQQYEQIDLPFYHLNPLIFNTQYFLVMIGTNCVYLSNLTNNQITFSIIPNQFNNLTVSQASYIEIESQNLGILTVQNLDASSGTMQIIIYEVTSTPTTVDFKLIAQSNWFGMPQNTVYTTLTNQYDAKRAANLYGCIVVSEQSIQIFYYYGPIQDNITLSQASVILEESLQEYDKIWIKQYIGLSYPNSIILAVQTPLWGGLFSLNLQNLNFYNEMILKQLYPLQQFQGYQAVGIQVQGNLIVSLFQLQINQSIAVVVGLYQEPSFYPTNTVLNFKAFQTVTIQTTNQYYSPVNSALTSNGTLVLILENQASLLYLTSQLYLGLNLSQQYVNRGYSSIYAPVLLNARNNFSSATQELYLQFQILNGIVEFLPASDVKWFYIGFGILFAVVIFTAIGWLCYKSMTKFYGYQEI